MLEQDFQPRVLAQEIIGLTEADVPELEEHFRSSREAYRTCLEPTLVAPEVIDPRIKVFELQLNTVNQDRAKKFGRSYHPPEIFYLDRRKGLELGASINAALTAQGLPKFDSSGGMFQRGGNFIVLSVNNFEADRDIDAYSTARMLRHELSHAGSVGKMRAYTEPDRTSLETYREGGVLSSRKRKNTFGIVLDEGHHDLEDLIFEGKYPDFRAADPFLQKIQTADELFPEARAKYHQLQADEISKGHMPENSMLIACLQMDALGNYATFSAQTYAKYSDLLETIYAGDPAIFLAGNDFIYGDKMFTFAKKLNQRYGPKFFNALMALQNRADVDLFKKTLLDTPY